MNREHVTFLGFVAPEFHRAQTAICARNVTNLQLGALAVGVDDLRHGVGETACADVVNGYDGIVFVQCPTGVYNLLCSALHFGIAALH